MLGTIAASLITAGPSLIRAAGSMMGGDTKAVAEKAAQVVESVSGSADPQAEAERQLQSLSPEQITALESVKVQAERIKAEVKQAKLAYDTTLVEQEHETRRAEIASDDSFVRRTRPEMARRSAAIGSLYVLLFETAHTVGAFVDKTVPGADIYIAGMLFAPLMAYIGGRTAERFSKQGPTASGAGFIESITRRIKR